MGPHCIGRAFGSGNAPFLRLTDLSKIFSNRARCYGKALTFVPALSVRPGLSVLTSWRSQFTCATRAGARGIFGTEKGSRSSISWRELHSRSVTTTTMKGSLGFYGGGMMAEAILLRLLEQKVVEPSRVNVCELSPARRQELEKLGVTVTADGEEMLSSSDCVVLAVKPNIIPVILQTVMKHEEKKSLSDTLYISICAGVTLEALSEGNPERKCVRVMPNQPCLVGEAASAYTMSPTCTQEHREIVEELMGACGVLSEVPEKSLDAVTGLSGSGPAYVYMMMEAMSDAGVKEGLPRAVARQLAAQTVLGAAKMALEMPNVHLGELRNRVESPGGTTIAATATLESNGFRSAVIEAVAAAVERSKEMGRKD